MATPCIITVAITGSVPKKADNQAAAMERDGRIEGPLHVQFVMGVKNAMPVDREALEFHVKTLKRLQTLASSNAALVKQVAAMCGEYGRRPATVAEARKLLGLPLAA